MSTKAESHPAFVSLRPSGSSVGVHFKLPHGRGCRYDTVTVPIEPLLTLADAYRGCLLAHHHVHESPHSTPHAIWHADNPGMPIPCANNTAKGPDDGTPLAQIVKNYLGAVDAVNELLAELAAGASEIRQRGIAQDMPFRERIRDEALATLRKAIGP